jgi:hypothetical protein
MRPDLDLYSKLGEYASQGKVFQWKVKKFKFIFIHADIIDE